MKVNIKDDQSGQKRDSEKLATIKKSEKPGDSKISAAKKTAISEVIVNNITNQTPVPAQSTSIENIIHFTNPEKAFTPLASTFTGVTFSKDLALLGNSSNYCQPSVFEQSSIPRSLPNDLSSNTTNSSQFESVVQSVEENIATLNDSLSKQQSSTAKPTMQSSLMVSNVIKSSQTVTDESMKETTIDHNDSLSNIQSSTPARLLMHNSLVDPCMVDSPQITTIEPEKENTTTLNDSLSNLSSTTVTPLIQNSLVSDTINSQSTPDVQPMEENGTFDDFLQVQEPLNSMKSPMQNNSCNNVVDLEKFESTAQIVEKNTTQVLTVPLAESKSKEVNSNKLSNIQRASNSLLTPVQNSPSNTQKACNALKRLQCSMSIQTEASDNTTSSVSKSDKKTPSQNPPTKGVKRKAEEIESTVKVQNSPSNIQKVQKVQNSPSNIQKACNALKRLQYSMSAQTEASDNTTSSVSKSDKKMLPSQNPPTKGVKRKAEKIENTVKNSGNSGKKKNNKKRQKFIPQIFKKKRNTSQNNFPPMTNYKSLMCAIVEEQYPNMPPLTNVHLGTIRNVIKEKIDNLPFGGFVPKFMNAFIKDGVILVECADSNSKEWLKSAITNYNPAEGIYLKVIPPETINQYYPASIFVQDEENAIDVLKRMQKQNPDISIRNWQYLSMIIVKESTPGITINVGIPATSVAQLKEKHFKLFHAVSQVTVVMKVKVPF